MLYRVGDKVVIKTDLDTDKEYYMCNNEEYCYVTEEMLVHAGKIVTITGVDYYGYEIAECNDEHNTWLWTDEMLLSSEEAEAPAVPVVSFFDFAGGDNRVQV